jgi:hypothetical protein
LGAARHLDGLAGHNEKNNDHDHKRMVHENASKSVKYPKNQAETPERETF